MHARQKHDIKHGKSRKEYPLFLSSQFPDIPDIFTAKYRRVTPEEQAEKYQKHTHLIHNLGSMLFLTKYSF